MWDLPGPGVEPVSPALAGGLPTTAPPGKSLMFSILNMRAYTHTHTHTHALTQTSSYCLEPHP